MVGKCSQSVFDSCLSFAKGNVYNYVVILCHSKIFEVLMIGCFYRTLSAGLALW